MKLLSKKWQVLIFLSIMSIFAASCTGYTMPITLEASKVVVSLGEHTNIQCIASNSTGNITYEWSDDGGIIQGAGNLTDWFADSAGNYTIEVETHGDNGEKGKAAITITVVGNHIPVIEELAITPENPKYLKGNKVLKNQKYEIECVTLDKDGDELSYTWSCDDKGKLSGKGAKITWTARSKGEATVTVTVEDPLGGTVNDSLVFDIKTCSCSFK